MGGGILEGKKRNKRRVRCAVPGHFQTTSHFKHVPGTKIIRRALFIPDYGPDSTYSGLNGTYSLDFQDVSGTVAYSLIVVKNRIGENLPLMMRNDASRYKM